MYTLLYVVTPVGDVVCWCRFPEVLAFTNPKLYGREVRKRQQINNKSAFLCERRTREILSSSVDECLRGVGRRGGGEIHFHIEWWAVPSNFYLTIQEQLPVNWTGDLS